jgi:maleate cis-trans isomerase
MERLVQQDFPEVEVMGGNGRMALRAPDRIEQAIRKPVITTHGATLWNALRVVGREAAWPVCGGMD